MSQYFIVTLETSVLVYCVLCIYDFKILGLNFARYFWLWTNKLFMINIWID